MALGQISLDMEAECTSKHEEESKYFLEEVSSLKHEGYSTYQLET
jgi:hypothetical protein